MLKLILMAFAILITSVSYTESIHAQELKKYTLGIGSSIGQLTSKQSTKYESDTGADNIYFNYQYNKTLSYELNLVKAETNAFCIITCFSDHTTRRLEYKLAAFLVKGSYEFSTRWSTFAKLGANYHQLEAVKTGDSIITNFSIEKGIGSSAAIGFEFRALNGFGLIFDYSYTGMGEYRASLAGLHVSYKF